MDRITLYATGIIFCAAFVGIASASGQSWSVIGFWIGRIIAWAWIAAIAAMLLTAKDASSRAENESNER